jgi:hypothetical protein
LVSRGPARNARRDESGEDAPHDGRRLLSPHKHRTFSRARSDVLASSYATWRRTPGAKGSIVTSTGREQLRDDRPTLDSLGINKKQSARWQKLAVPAENAPVLPKTPQGRAGQAPPRYARRAIVGFRGVFRAVATRRERRTELSQRNSLRLSRHFAPFAARERNGERAHGDVRRVERQRAFRVPILLESASSGEKRAPSIATTGAIGCEADPVALCETLRRGRFVVVVAAEK